MGGFELLLQVSESVMSGCLDAAPRHRFLPALCARLLKVWSLMNLAYAAHEIVSDYVTVALLWFESGCAGGGRGRRARPALVTSWLSSRVGSAVQRAAASTCHSR